MLAGVKDLLADDEVGLECSLVCTWYYVPRYTFQDDHKGVIPLAWIVAEDGLIWIVDVNCEPWQQSLDQIDIHLIEAYKSGF